ncbi:MAG: hypothetical protein AB1609_17220 [Bacillota bacterium]
MEGEIAGRLVGKVQEFLKQQGWPGEWLLALCEEAVAHGLEQVVLTGEGIREESITVRPVETPEEKLRVYLRVLYAYLVELPACVKSAVSRLDEVAEQSGIARGQKLEFKVDLSGGVPESPLYADMREIAAHAHTNYIAFSGLLLALDKAGERGVADWISNGAWSRQSNKHYEP